jgi:hypothetical protein
MATTTRAKALKDSGLNAVEKAHILAPWRAGGAFGLTNNTSCGDGIKEWRGGINLSGLHMSPPARIYLSLIAHEKTSLVWFPPYWNQEIG